MLAEWGVQGETSTAPGEEVGLSPGCAGRGGRSLEDTRAWLSGSVAGGRDLADCGGVGAGCGRKWRGDHLGVQQG